jgi:hypothetical protein
MFIHFVAVPAFVLPKIPPKPPVGLDDPEVPVQDGEIGRHHFKIMFV